MAEWIKKKEKPKSWITKKEYLSKEKPKSWITKKEKSKKTEWIKKKERPLKEKLKSANIEGFIESTKDTVHPLKGDRVAGRGEKKLTVKTHPKTSKSTYTLSNRGTTGTNWRAGKDRIDKWVKSGDAEKNYKKTGKLFTNYSGKMKKGGRAGFQHGGRTNLLEELGRVEGEHSNRNRRAEVSRIHGELNKGYKGGGAVLKGKKVGIQIK